jgi:hypothetical protein
VSKDSKGAGRKPRTANKKPRRAAGAAAAKPSRSAAEPDKAGFEFPTGAFASLGKVFDLQRKVLRAGGAAARSAARHPASKLVTDGVTESVQGGLRKLEQVFDERVAAALARMGMPSPEALREACAVLTARGDTPPRRKRAKSPKGR